MASIKQENGGTPIKAEELDHNNALHVKNEPMSDEEYEDAGDLDMTKGGQMGWLIKVPKFLYERWDEIDDDEEITLGEVLINPANDERFKIKLNDTLEVHKDLPLTYDMILNERSVDNTWVFSEKDMPGFDKKTNVVADANMPELPARFLYGEREKKNFPDRPKGQWNKNQHRAPYIRKAIPKKTALVGTIAHEAAIITPLEDPKYGALMAEQAKKKAKPKRIELLTGVQSTNLLAPGTMGAATGNFDTFIKRVEPTKKPQENKAARMDKHALIDALFACFKQYKAWTMKGLKEKLNQPEAYLKEVLNEIAQLHKTGPLASKYSLKPEYAQHTEEQIQAALEAENNEGKNASDAIAIEDDDDDEEFEDAL